MSDNSRLPDAASLLALLVAGDRLPVVAALVLGSRTLPEIAERAGVATRDALRVLTRLESAGLASIDGVNWALHVDVLRAAVTGNHWPAATSTVDDSAAATPQEAAVLRAFLRDGRLLRVPAQRTKRLVILDFIAREFEPGVQYAETDVNQKLSAFHPDYAALRRYLVEEDYLARENGVYWRAGGSVEV